MLVPVHQNLAAGVQAVAGEAEEAVEAEVAAAAIVPGRPQRHHQRVQ